MNIKKLSTFLTSKHYQDLQQILWRPTGTQSSCPMTLYLHLPEVLTNILVFVFKSTYQYPLTLKNMLITSASRINNCFVAWWWTKLQIWNHNFTFATCSTTKKYHTYLLNSSMTSFIFLQTKLVIKIGVPDVAWAIESSSKSMLPPPMSWSDTSAP